jgi:GTP-binding protein
MNQIKDDKTHFVKTKEFLFVGRSNTGKSSLINNIFHDKKIARAAKRSGTTKFLHFHRLHHFPGLVVDAPGYGYARMNKRRRETWFGLV